MAWTAPKTWVTAEVVTAAMMNTHVRDNMNATAAAKVTTAGDLTYATGANALSRLAVGAANKVLVSSGTAPTWANVPVHATQHGDSGSDPLGAGSVTDSMLSGDILNRMILHAYTEVASASVSATETAVVNATVVVPTDWVSWRCWATATMGYNTYGVGSFWAYLQIDGTNVQGLNVDAFTDFITPATITGHRTGMTTTGNRTVKLVVKHGGASGTGTVTDMNLNVQAYQVS